MTARRVLACFGLPSPAFVEMDWYVVKDLAAIAAADTTPSQLVFGGGTALSRTHGIPKTGTSKSESAAGSAVTGWKSRERLAAPVAEIRDVQTRRSRSLREGPDGLYQEITDKIIAELEVGRVPWVQPWGTAAVKASLTMPKNAATQRQYSGINVLISGTL